MDEHEHNVDMTTDATQWSSDTFTFSKRQIGILCLVVGILGFIGLLLLDVIGGGREGGIGPSQQLGIGAMVALAILGLSLIPLGDDAI